MEDYIRRKEAAEILGYCPVYFGHLARTGKVPAHLVGRRMSGRGKWLFKRSELEEFKSQTEIIQKREVE